MSTYGPAEQAGALRRYAITALRAGDVTAARDLVARADALDPQ